MVTREDLVKRIAEICFRIADESAGIVQYLKTGNRREAEVALDKQVAPVANVIRKAMLARLVMAMMRMHDKPARNRETLPMAFDLLRD